MFDFQQVEEIAIRFDSLSIALIISRRRPQASGVIERAILTPSSPGVIDSMTLMFLKKVA
jgi:hypothetical protein